MSKKPFISIIIPVRTLSYYLLFESLPEFAKQTYNNFEIIILPNEHSPYDLTLLKQNKKIRIIPTGNITRPAQKRDIGAKEAKGQIIAFIDDDAYPDPQWLKSAVNIFNKRKIRAVCGPGILPPTATFWERVFDEVLKSPIGAGNYTYRFKKAARRYVTDYPSMNFFIQRKNFLELGGFNSNFWPGEDSKLCNDLIIQSKKSILYSPDVVVFHHRRANLRDFLQQHSRYGFHRGAFFAHRDKNSMEIGYVIPTFFLIYLVLFPSAITLLIIFDKLSFQNLIMISAPFIAYCVLVVHLLLQSFFNTWNPAISVSSITTLFLTHIVYGSMFIKGFKKGKNNNQNIYE